MKAGERIEEILSQFGQTISDLPPVSEFYYEQSHLNAYTKAALTEYYHKEIGDYDMVTLGELINALTLYGLHLNDVIDRLCWALESTPTYRHHEKEEAVG